ncbi:MAG: hypothetical protein ABSB35_04480 [Bryobacteraceae bacterium]|jgi:hypothetical protein
MKFFYFVFAVGVLLASDSARTFTGVITDTMCGAKHSMMKNQPDDECVKMCTKGSSEYALFDGMQVLKLSDQKNSAKFAAQRVKIAGTYNEKTKTIKVTSIEAAGND